MTDPALHTLFRAKRDEIARQVTGLWRTATPHGSSTGRCSCTAPSPRLSQRPRDELLATHPAAGSQHADRHRRCVRGGGPGGVRPLPGGVPGVPGASVEVRDDVSELMVSFGRLLIPESAAFRADRVEPLLHHEVGTHVVTFQNGARQPLTLLTIGLPGYDETQEGLAVLAEYLTGGLDPRRLRVLAATGRRRRQDARRAPGSWRSSSRCAPTTAIPTPGPRGPSPSGSSSAAAR